ncbi:MAG: phosphopyruvate hydratase [Cryobacterium sp.]|nr:phosphopyruvate hydratase [Oligoflexia bacterium]
MSTKPAFSSLKIESIHAREILDSRGFPTVEVDLVLSGGKIANARGTALVPSGASTGEGEALELRDGDKARYSGKGVLKAVSNVNEILKSALVGKTFASLEALDEAMIALDGTPNKAKLGANAVLGVSMAYLRAAAISHEMPLFEVISQVYGSEGITLPVPMMNIINGGKHADNGLAIQEFMIVPRGFSKFSEALRAGSEIFHTLKKILHDRGLSTGVGDEGGFAPAVPGANPHEEVIKLIMQAIEKAGYEAGKQVFLAFDCAASEFLAKTSTKEKTLYAFEGKDRTASEMTAIYSAWVEKYPVISIEDGLAEHDWAGWAEHTEVLGKKIQLVGDDLFVTNITFLKQGIDRKIANSILIKVNQIGTVTETFRTMQMAKAAKYTQVSSHRSGETEDSFIADLAVGTDCGQIKTGSLSRTDRIAKYNQLLRIEEKLGSRARYAGK